MPRISISMSDDADKELKELSEQTGKPIALLIREAIEMYLNVTLGREVNVKVKWGGHRGSKNDESPPE